MNAFFKVQVTIALAVIYFSSIAAAREISVRIPPISTSPVKTPVKIALELSLDMVAQNSFTKPPLQGPAFPVKDPAEAPMRTPVKAPIRSIPEPT